MSPKEAIEEAEYANRTLGMKAFMIGGKAPASFAVRRTEDYDISDAALLPNGDLLVLERKGHPGGGVSTRELTVPGYRHDEHSNVHIMIQGNPMIRQDELGLIGRFGLKYKYSETPHATVFPDQTALVTYKDLDRTCEGIAKFSPRDAEAYRRLAAQAREEPLRLLPRDHRLDGGRRRSRTHDDRQVPRRGLVARRRARRDGAERSTRQAGDRQLGDYDPFDSFAQAFAEVPTAGFLDRCLYVDIKTWLQDDILVKVDRLSMANSVEPSGVVSPKSSSSLATASLSSTEYVIPSRCAPSRRVVSYTWNASVTGIRRSCGASCGCRGHARSGCPPVPGEAAW